MSLSPTARNAAGPWHREMTNRLWAAAHFSTAPTSRLSGRPISAPCPPGTKIDRKSTRLNSSHLVISYAVFCLKKKKKEQQVRQHHLTTFKTSTACSISWQEPVFDPLPQRGTQCKLLALEQQQNDSRHPMELVL